MATTKRPRSGSGGAVDLKRASEIVMVLSALGEMRGGRDPTTAEKALVSEARELLVGLCERVKPKDLFSREAVKFIVEDFGLDPRFRSPKISIADKLMLTKKKMEKSEERLKLNVPSTRSSFLAQVGGLRAEYALSKASSTSALGQESNAFQSSNQLTISPGMQASVVHTVPESLLIGHPSSRSLTYVHADSDITIHNDIANKVEMVLQQKVSDQSICTLPSFDFMNRPLSCQVCMIIINDGESLLVCDTCEKGTHLKCLRPFVNGITSKTVWHCPKCVKANNGKSFPPKYGPVIRLSGTAKASLNTLVYPVKRRDHSVATERRFSICHAALMEHLTNFKIMFLFLVTAGNYSPPNYSLCGRTRKPGQSGLLWIHITFPATFQRLSSDHLPLKKVRYMLLQVRGSPYWLARFMVLVKS